MNNIIKAILLALCLLALLLIPVGSSGEPEEGFDWEYYDHDTSGLLEED